MRFNFLDNQDGRCYIEDFLSGLDEETHLKVINKLGDFESFDQAHLFRAEHIKKIEQGVHEIRVRTRRKCYRFLGRIRGEEFDVVHVYHKKSNSIPMKEIRTTRNRLNNI